MPDTNQPNSRPKKEPPDNKKVVDAGLKRILIWGSVLLVVLLVFTFAQRAGRIPFFTENLLSLLILIVIAVQAYIYRRQWEAMQQGLERTDKVIEKMEAQSEILRKQAKSMDESVVFGLRAYVGIHSIGINFKTNRLSIQVENIGRVPAKDVKIDVVMEVAIPAGCMPEGYNRGLGAYVFTTKTIPYRFGEAKLFPGNLNIKIMIPIKRWLAEGLSDEQILLIAQAHARLIVRGNINFCDGFHTDKNTPFALRYSARADCWLPHGILSPEEEEKAREEQPYYED